MSRHYDAEDFLEIKLKSEIKLLPSNLGSVKEGIKRRLVHDLFKYASCYHHHHHQTWKFSFILREKREQYSEIILKANFFFLFEKCPQVCPAARWCSSWLEGVRSSRHNIGTNFRYRCVLLGSLLGSCDCLVAFRRPHCPRLHQECRTRLLATISLWQLFSSYFSWGVSGWIWQDSWNN